jgi:hypothetical protein
MVNYKCPRCGYETHIKTIYTRHLGRKVICKPIISHNNLIDEYKKYNIIDKISNTQNTTKKPQNTTKYTKETTKIPQNTTIYTNEITKIPQNTTKLVCEHCNKTYSRIDSLNRHLKKCTEKKNDDEEKQNLINLIEVLNKQIEEQKKEKEEYKIELAKRNSQIDELIKKAGINIGTQNNIQQNIKILAYNNTDVSHLTDNDYLKCLKHSNFCIPHLIEKIHFNPKKPENHNIYISNLKNNYVMIYNGNKWMLNDREESIQNLIDEKESIIEQKLEEWIENGKNYPDIMKKFNRYLEKKENDTVLNKIKGEIKLMLFNNRDIVKY